MNNFQQSTVMQKGHYGSTNAGNSIANWMHGKRPCYLLVTPVPEFATNGVLNPPLQGGFLDRTYTFKTFGFSAQDDYRATSHRTLNLGLRYEFQTIPHELYGRSSTIPDLQGGSNTYKVGSIFNHNWTLGNGSPRAGFAWDVFGTGKTSLRGGFGIYYDVANIGSLLTQNASGVPPIAAQTQVAQSPTAYTIPIIDVNGNPLDFTRAQLGKALQMNDPNMQNAHVLQYNLTLEQQLPLGIGLQVSYVGNRGINIWFLVEGNPVVPEGYNNGVPFYNVTNGEALCQNNALSLDANGNPEPLVLPINGVPTTILPGDPHYPCRINPYFTSALFVISPSNSWYNALQVLGTKRLSGGLDFQGAYTYSRAIDTTSGQMYNTDCRGTAIGTAIGFFPGNLNLDKGVSSTEVPHSMQLSLLYHFPTTGSTGFFAKLVNGWWMGNIVRISDGFPFTPLITQDRSFSGVITQSNSSKPSLNTAANTVTLGVSSHSNPASGCSTNTCTYNFVPYDPATVITGDPNHWFDPLMFGEGPLGQQGDTPRDTLRMPGLGEWDFSLAKDTKLGFLGEQGNLEFRAEFFNILNRANFGIPSGTVFAGTLAANTLAGGNIQPLVGASAANPLGTAGQITTTATTSRQIQFALKVIF